VAGRIRSISASTGYATPETCRVEMSIVLNRLNVQFFRCYLLILLLKYKTVIMTSLKHKINLLFVP
jgi:hypothetical protein